MNFDPRRLGPALLALARDAGDAIMQVYASPIASRTKADHSPVTDADEAAEAIILAGLEKLTPGIPVVAEEKSARGDIPDITNSPFWLVDPLDVTVLGRQPAGRELVYAGGFFLLWAMAAFSSALSLYMSRGAGKDEAEDDWA